MTERASKQMSKMSRDLCLFIINPFFQPVAHAPGTVFRPVATAPGTVIIEI
jgi:hypothetical protein